MTRIHRLDTETQDEVREQEEARFVIWLWARRMRGDEERAKEVLASYGYRWDGPVTHGGTGAGAR